MATHIVMASSQAWLANAFSWSSVGFVLLAIGIIATFFSSRRYLLGYLIGGMSYYLVVEGVQSAISALTPASVGVSYALAFISTLLAMAALVVYRYNKAAATKPVTHANRLTPLLRGNKRLAAKRDKYIEHTPIYNNYKPRFRN